MVAAEGRRNNDPCCMFAPSFLIMDLVCIPFMFGLNKQARVRWLTIKQTLERNSSDECWMSLFRNIVFGLATFGRKLNFVNLFTGISNGLVVHFLILNIN